MLVVYRQTTHISFIFRTGSNIYLIKHHRNERLIVQPGQGLLTATLLNYRELGRDIKIKLFTVLQTVTGTQCFLWNICLFRFSVKFPFFPTEYQQTRVENVGFRRQHIAGDLVKNITTSTPTALLRDVKYEPSSSGTTNRQRNRMYDDGPLSTTNKNKR